MFCTSGRSDPLPGISRRTSTAVLSRGDERLQIRRRPDEVRVGDPQPLAGDRRDQLIEAEHAGRGRLRGNHTKRGGASRCDRAGRHYFVRWQRRAGRRPDVGKRALDVGHRRAPDGHAGVAPGIRAVAAVSTAPHVADAESGHEADASVHTEHLAMVARHPPERRIETGLVEGAHVGAGAAQARPEHPGGGGERAGPVIDDTDLDAALRGGHQRGRKLPPALVVMNDVALEVDPAFGGANRLEPRGVVLFGIPEEADLVSFDQRRTGRPRKRLIRHHAQGAGHGDQVWQFRCGSSKFKVSMIESSATR